jgi:S1-C subfamily serine protease
MRTIAALAAAALLAAAPARPDEGRTREAARAALVRSGPALVTVRLTVKSRITYEGRQQEGPESTQEVQGTLVSPDGLTVLSDFTTNPAALFEREGGPRVETETSEVKLVLQDGRELPARFVLRDADLDLAFVAPVDAVAALPAVRFEQGAALAPLDDLIVLAQLGKTLNREVGVTVGKVRAVVKRPRTFVVPSPMEGLLGLGCPVFDDRGRAIGLVLLRRTPGVGLEVHGFRDVFEGIAAVVLTAADLQDAIGQAAAARASARKDAGPAPAAQ